MKIELKPFQVGIFFGGWFILFLVYLFLYSYMKDGANSFAVGFMISTIMFSLFIYVLAVLLAAEECKYKRPILTISIDKKDINKLMFWKKEITPEQLKNMPVKNWRKEFENR